jgi:hypothetical protein
VLCSSDFEEKVSHGHKIHVHTGAAFGGRMHVRLRLGRTCTSAAAALHSGTSSTNRSGIYCSSTSTEPRSGIYCFSISTGCRSGI